MPEAEAGGHYSLISSRENQHLLSSDNQHVSISSRENQHLISGENQHVPISSRENQQHAQITSDSPLWRLFLDSSCSSASVFLRQKTFLQTQKTDFKSNNRKSESLSVSCFEKFSSNERS